MNEPQLRAPYKHRYIKIESPERDAKNHFLEELNEYAAKLKKDALLEWSGHPDFIQVEEPELSVYPARDRNGYDYAALKIKVDVCLINRDYKEKIEAWEAQLRVRGEKNRAEFRAFLAKQ